MLTEAFGSLQGMVDGLGVDFGCLKSEVNSIRTGIGSLETSMTEQVRGASSGFREMFQISGLVSVLSRSPEIQGNAASFGTSQSQIFSSQGGPWVPGKAAQTKSVDVGNFKFSGGPGGLLSSLCSVSAGGQVSTSFPRSLRKSIRQMLVSYPGQCLVRVALTQDSQVQYPISLGE